MGRTLKAEDGNTSTFFNILQENGLTRIAKMSEFKEFLKQQSHDHDLVLRALQKYGPIMIGGMYGRILKKKMGHYIVLSGIATERQMFEINDPGESQPDWRPYYRVYKDYWGNVFPPDDGCNAVAVRPS